MCDCRTAVNERLKVSNARVASGFVFGGHQGLGKMCLSPPMIMLEKIDQKRKGKPPTLLATYCPFCGERYKGIDDEAPKTDRL